MIKNLSVAAVVLLVGVAQQSVAQASEETLFTVGNEPVSVEEFDYIYAKTNGDSATYSRESLQEYLDLYKRFKLKVAKAKEMGLDTVPALQQELAGYRRQLADSYLVDQEVTEPMARELWNRQQEDVNVLHIAVNLPKMGEDTTAAYEKAEAAYERIKRGDMWGEVARDLSDDPSAKRNAGEVGYVTAPLPEGLYALENAVYHTPLGSVSPIVRSDKAYHIVKVLDRRPARGEVEAAHIFLRKPKEGGDSEVKARIDSIYRALEAGAEFDDLARELSEDTRSAPRGGYIGFFGINRYEKALEDSAFGIEEDGAYAEPIETRVGWHIVRRVSRRTPGTWADSRQGLMTRIKRMPRFQDGRREMVKRLHKDYDFTENAKVLDNYVRSLPDSFLNYRWRPGPVDDVILFSFNGDDGQVKLADFTDYLRRNASKRIRMEGVASVEQAARALYEDFVLDQTFVYAERRLDQDNPAFYNLMREYQEGILLFEATKQKVWDQAGQDTTGLKKFYAANQDDYMWDERVLLDVYTIDQDRQDELFSPLVKYARKHSAEEVLEKYNESDSTAVRHHTRTVERGREPSIDKIEWKRGNALAPEVDTRTKELRIGVVRETMSPAVKRLDEARGYVIADYQDELERRWVAELARQYPVQVNEQAFESLIKQP